MGCIVKRTCTILESSCMMVRTHKFKAASAIQWTSVHRVHETCCSLDPITTQTTVRKCLRQLVYDHTSLISISRLSICLFICLFVSLPVSKTCSSHDDFLPDSPSVLLAVCHYVSGLPSQYYFVAQSDVHAWGRQGCPPYQVLEHPRSKSAGDYLQATGVFPLTSCFVSYCPIRHCFVAYCSHSHAAHSLTGG